MSTQVINYSVTTPVGTAIATPLVTNLPLGPRLVRAIDIVVPTGLNGVLGFALGLAGQAVIPANAGAWDVTSGEVVHHELANLPSSGAWQLITYNVGYYPHTLQVRFTVDLTIDPGSTDSTVLIPSINLSAPPVGDVPIDSQALPTSSVGGGLVQGG